jgi:NlpC/P60 family putative phage cell wall peptidase
VEPEPIAPYTPDWAEAKGEETLAMAARRHLEEISVGAATAGDVLLFRWRSGLPAKHAGVLVERQRFVHAHQGAAVSTATYSRWWRGRVAYAFRFPSAED